MQLQSLRNMPTFTSFAALVIRNRTNEVSKVLDLEDDAKREIDAVNGYIPNLYGVCH